MGKNKVKLTVHMIGVGGSGMSALCKYLLLKKINVTGSDVKESEVVSTLINLGLKFFLGHEHDAVEHADIVVYSSAINFENRELLTAKSLKKALYTRAELLQIILNVHKRSIGICGSHGKTTTVSMLAHVLKRAGINVNSFVGGEDKVASVYNLSDKSDVALCEVCEYNKNISSIKSTVAVCLNVDSDHLDTYGDVESINREFKSFLSRAKKRFVNADDYYLKECKLKNTVTFGIDNNCDFKAENLRIVDGNYSFVVKEKGTLVFKVSLKIPGKVNVYNAISVIAVAKAVFNIENEVIANALNDYYGVKRRFENLGALYGKRVICDYAHHPTEIENLIKTVKSIYNDNYILVFQPHTYSRTRILFNDFLKVFENEKVLIYKEFASREEYDYLGSSENLHKNLDKSEYYDDFSKLIKRVSKIKKDNIIVIGAGDLYDLFNSKIKIL